MLQLSIAAACCTFLLISSATADEVEDSRWKRQASSERERRIDDWVPVTDPCPTCKRPLIGEQRPGQSDDISSLLTPPSFGKPRNLPLSIQGQNTVQFPANNGPFQLRQANGAPNFLQPGQRNPFIQETKQQPFFSAPQSQPQQSIGFQQSPFFIPPQQSRFPLLNQPKPQFDFIQQQSVNSRPQSLPPQFNNRLPPKTNTFPGVVTPVQIGALQNENEEVQLLYVPVETLQKNKLKELKPFGKQSFEKGPPFQQSPTPQSILKDQRFTPPAEQLNQREPKQNFNGVPPQFGNPPFFQSQQIGDTKFNTVFDQNFRYPGFQPFSQTQAPQQPPPPQSFMTFENQNRFEFAQQQQPPAIPSTQLRQSTQAFNQFLPQTQPPPFTNQVDNKFAPPFPSNPPPNQPPLAVYMERNENSQDVLSILKEAKTIPVLDQVEEQTPIVFVGPSSLDPPKGYVKFDLPYLSSLESNRIERKIANLPFFVAPLNFKPPPGYSKIPFPAPHIGSVVISNSTVFKDALEKTSTTHKVSFSAFDFTTQKTFPEITQSPNFFEETRFNEISSTTPLPSTFKQFTSTPPFESTQKQKFETARPHFDYQDAQFTRKPTIETLPTYAQNNQFTQPPPEFKPEFEKAQPQYNVNIQQDTRQPQFVQQQFNTETQFSPEQPAVIPQFSAGKPTDVQQMHFLSASTQLDGKQPFNDQQQQFNVQQETTTNPSSFQQFETQKPQFEGEQVTYQTYSGQFNTNNQEQKVPEFVNQREQELINQREQGFSQTKTPQFDSPNTFGTNQPQFVNNQQVQSDIDSQYNSRDQIYNQQNSFVPQNNDFASQQNIPTEEQKVVSQQFQNEFTTEAPAQVESTTVYIPRRKTTPRQEYKSSTVQYKASTPPPNYNPRRNRKPLYRGIPKNLGEIQTTTLPSPATDSNEQQRLLFTNSDITKSNQVETHYEEPSANRYENKYETFNQNKEYQTASESYYQPEIENTVGPVFEQKQITENYQKTEKDETLDKITAPTPNYSNFQGINQFFNQVIQKENVYPTNEIITTPADLPITQAPFYTVQQETTPSPVYTESSVQTESSSQQSVSVNDQEYTKKPSYSEKRHRYRQKLQNTVTTQENTPVYDSTQKTEYSETEKPLRNKNKYRSRQRTGSRGQHTTSTEAAVDENIPAHFSSIRGQHENTHLSTDHSEYQSTSTEHASTKIDVGKYGTFKRRRPVKAYERTTTPRESEFSSVEYETTAATVSATRPYRTRARTTAFPGERVLRHRTRKPTTTTTAPETSSVSEYTETTTRGEANTNVDWGSYVSSFSPSAQGNDVLGSLDDQNRISKTEENSIDQQYTIQRSQSPITPPDQTLYSTNDQESVSQFDTRKFSSKKLHSGFVESDNTQHDLPVVPSFDSQLDSQSQVQEERNLQTFEVEDKSALDKGTDGKKTYDPTTGKKAGGRRRGQWVRVRVKKPNQEYFETAESQNVANIGNSVQNPTKPSVERLSSEEFAKLQANSKEQIKVEDHVYFTTTTEKYSTTSEDSPSKFDLEKGVSAMIAEFMNVDEDESKDNAKEIFEQVESRSTEKPIVQTVETSVEDEQVFESPIVTEEHLKPSDATFDKNVPFVSDKINNKVLGTDVQNRDELIYTEENVNENVGKVASFNQNENTYQIPSINENIHYLNPVSSEMSHGVFQNQNHETYSEEIDEIASQPKEREIKHTVNNNLNYEFSNHKYDSKDYVPEVQDAEIQGDKGVEKIVEEVSSNTTSVPLLTTDRQVQESPKELTTVLTDVPDTTTSATDSEGLTEDYNVVFTTDSSPVSATTHSKVLGTSTTTEISLETEICYKGRCIKSKKKRPQYQDLLKV